MGTGSHPSIDESSLGRDVFRVRLRSGLHGDFDGRLNDGAGDYSLLDSKARAGNIWRNEYSG